MSAPRTVTRRGIRWTFLAGVLITTFLSWIVSGCGGGSSTTLSTLDLPGVPTAFTVVPTQGTTLSATLSWSPPTSGGAPTNYVIYRSTTAGTAFSPTNLVTSIPAVTGQSTYTFIDNAELTSVPTYWVVSAENASGETPTAEVSITPIGPSNTSGDTGFGNNLSSPLIFADGYGITELPITGTWTADVATVDYNTGLRPLTAILPTTVTTLPYLDSADVYSLDGKTYYEQGTASTWQAQWENGAGTQQDVVATWGDNLTSQNLTSTSVIRVEIALSKTLATSMTGYKMQLLYGTNANEVQGTDGTTYLSTAAGVFATNAHLKIEKLDSNGTSVYVLYDQTLWQGDGPGYFAGEVTVSGSFTYGFVWNMKNVTLPSTVTKDGTWRITFSLDGKSPVGTNNNTTITSATNGVLDSSTQVHIDINVAN